MRLRGLLAPLMMLASILAIAPCRGQSVDVDYRIQPDDILVVTVRGEDDLSREYRVGPTGMVSFEMIGTHNVEGMTVPQLREMLVRLYDKYIINPSVTVNLRDLGGRRISVSGEVRVPGQYSMKPGMRVMDAIAAAGGLVEQRAETSAVSLIRKGVTMTLDLHRFRTEGESSQNIVVEEGDVIVVPSRYVGVVLVTGFVKSPGEVEIEKGETLVDVIGRAGGLGDGADPSRVAVVRKDGTTQIYDFRKAAAEEPALTLSNPFIYPGDRIDVKENTSYVVNVVGGVATPRSISYVDGLTYTQAIAHAGGPTPNAITKKTRILRTVDKEKGVTESIEVDYGKVMRAEQPDPSLQPGDTIDIPMRNPVDRFQQWAGYASAVVGLYLLWRNLRHEW
jgi:polysaccharide export outer membrane protein